MPQTDVQSPTRLVIRRTFSASRERLFAAFTQPAQMHEWMGPGAVNASDIVTDPQVGGTYRIAMEPPEGGRLIVRGVYREVLPPERLVFTWCWEEDRPAEEIETLVTVELYVHGDQTELVLTHEDFASAESRGNHDRGWTATMDQLAAYLSG